MGIFKPVRQLTLRSCFLWLTLACIVGGHLADGVARRRKVAHWLSNNPGGVGLFRCENRPTWCERVADALGADGWPDYWWREIDQIVFLQASLAPADLELLALCPRLKRLDLDYCDLSQFDLTRLAPLPNLEWLDLERTGITSEDLRGMARHTRLTALILDGNSIDDRAIDALAQLSSLRYLRVKETSLTPAGLLRMQQQLPECRIVADQAKL